MTNFLNAEKKQAQSLFHAGERPLVLHVTPEGRLAFGDVIFIPKELNMPLTQIFSCIDDQISFQRQIQIFMEICAERMAVINVLDAEVQRLRNIVSKVSCVDSIFSRFKSWVQ